MAATGTASTLDRGKEEPEIEDNDDKANTSLVLRSIAAEISSQAEEQYLLFLPFLFFFFLLLDLSL